MSADMPHIKCSTEHLIKGAAMSHEIIGALVGALLGPGFGLLIAPKKPEDPLGMYLAKLLALSAGGAGLGYIGGKYLLPEIVGLARSTEDTTGVTTPQVVYRYIPRYTEVASSPEVKKEDPPPWYDLLPGVEKYYGLPKATTEGLGALILGAIGTLVGRRFLARRPVGVITSADQVMHHLAPGATVFDAVATQRAAAAAARSQATGRTPPPGGRGGTPPPGGRGGQGGPDGGHGPSASGAGAPGDGGGGLWDVLRRLGRRRAPGT